MKKIYLLLIIAALLFIPVSVLAKGPFSYITITGPGLSGDLHVTDPALMNFFAFSDFFKGGMDAPVNPGEGYEVIRSFLDSETKKVQNFDYLHYYPDTGYVYYDGLINGSSEYDSKWYKASSDVEAPFRDALKQTARLKWISLTALAVILAVFFIAYAYRSRPSSK